MEERERTRTQSLLIVVPSERPDLWQSLQHSFGDDTSVMVLPDRRRGANGAGHPVGRSREDRRRQPARDADLAAGRWVAVPLAARKVDLSDPDARAILFLCCSEHVVPCQACQDTYRLRWVRRSETGACTCPRCGSDLGPAVAAHTATCVYWAGRGAKIPPRDERLEAAS